MDTGRTGGRIKRQSIGVNALQTWGVPPFLLSPTLPSPFFPLPFPCTLYLPLNPAKGLGSPVTKRILVHLEVKMKRFGGYFFVFFNRQKRYLFYNSTITTKSNMLTKIVHRTRDCVRIIAGVQHVDGPLPVKYWGSGPL